MKKLTLFIYGIGILFLINSALQDFQAKAYWPLFMDLEFMGFALFMIFVYPKRKLKLNQDMMSFLMIHFSAYALMSFIDKNWLMAILGLAISLSLIAYRLYRKRHKYVFYLK